MFLQELLQQSCEVAVFLQRCDGCHRVEYPEGAVVCLVHLADVRICDHNVGQRLKVQQPSCEASRELQKGPLLKVADSRFKAVHTLVTTAKISVALRPFHERTDSNKSQQSNAGAAPALGQCLRCRSARPNFQPCTGHDSASASNQEAYEVDPIVVRPRINTSSPCALDFAPVDPETGGCRRRVHWPLVGCDQPCCVHTVRRERTGGQNGCHKGTCARVNVCISLLAKASTVVS